MNTAAVRISPRSAVVLSVASFAGLMMLCWPLLLRAGTGERVDPPFLFLGLLPIVIAVVLAELNEGGLDPRVLAVLGVLSAANAILRGLTAEGHAVLVATHDVEFVAQVADDVVVLADGEVVSSGPVRRVVAESPSFAPQVTKVLGAPWLRVDEVVAGLDA